MDSTVKQFEAVVDFMKACSQEVNTEFKLPSTKLGKFRLRLIKEEILELEEAIDNDDEIEILDAICDILYVTYGAYATFGLEPYDSSIAYKSTHFKSILSIGCAHAMVRRINDAFDQLSRGLNSDDQRTINTSLGYIMSSTLDLGEQSNFYLLGAFKEVHESNMSKFCSSKDEALEHCERIYKTKPEYNPATITIGKVGNNYIIRRGGDGKTLKGPSFFEPDLKKYLTNK